VTRWLKIAVAAALIATAVTAAPADAWSSPEVLDGAGGANGRVSAPIGADTAAVAYFGVPHVFYSAFVSGRYRLRHGSLSTPPTFERLDGAGGPNGRTTHSVGSDVSAAVFGGVMHVFYRDDTGGDLRHGWFDGTAWRFQTLDGASTVGGRVDSDVGQKSATTVFEGALEVLYLDAGNADVRRASYDGTAWRFGTIDGDSTEGGHTIHEVGFNIQAKKWGGSLHVLYYERDPAYGDQLGWVREAQFTGAHWVFQRAFRVSTIVPGKTLAVGVVDSTAVYVAYNTTFQGSPRLRWRLWNGTTWSDSSLLAEEDGGSVAAGALFVVVGGVPTLVFSDPGAFSPDTEYFTWSGGVVTSQFVRETGWPTSAVVIGGTTAQVFWGAASPTGCCDEVLLRTTGP
jgi:hypothetical protein